MLKKRAIRRLGKRGRQICRKARKNSVRKLEYDHPYDYQGFNYRFDEYLGGGSETPIRANRHTIYSGE